MAMLIESLKESLPAKTEGRVSGDVGSARTAKIMKPAKVPSWTRDLTLETYARQVQTWSDILEEYPEYVKYQDLVESLKTNKDVKGLSRYVGEHVLPVLEKKTDKMIAKVLDLLHLKYG